MVSKKSNIILGFCICTFNIASLISLIIYTFFSLMINPNMGQLVSHDLPGWEIIYSSLPMHMVKGIKMNQYLGSKPVITWLEKLC